MILAHPIAGLTITSLIKKHVGKLNSKQEIVFWLVGITSSVLPDFDLVYALLWSKENHHTLLTHTPFFYLIIGLILSIGLFIWEIIIKKYKKNITKKKLNEEIQKITFIEILIIIFLINTIIHILLDFPAGSISPFWPIYSESLSLIKISSQNWIKSYIQSPAIILEIFWMIAGIVVIITTTKTKAFRYATLYTLFWTVVAGILMLLLI